ncbi:MAG: PAS domain-containing protein [Rudaea sp.]
MSKSAEPSGFDFLANGGEMGAIMRALDWSATVLGDPSTWPQPLRTVVRLILNTGHPMYIWWGEYGACLYNDAYRASIGSERHPSSLGQPAREVWDEIWDVIGPQIAFVRSGAGSTWNVDHLVPITRNGRREDVYWTYSYSPIDDSSAPHGVGGVLVVCSETTGRVTAEQKLRAEIARQRRLFERAPGFVAILSGPEHHFEFVNEAYVQLLGVRDFVGRAVRDVAPEVEGQGFFERLDEVYASGQRFVAQQTPLLISREAGEPPQLRFLDFTYEPVQDEHGVVTGIFVQGFDVSERREADQKLSVLNATLEEQIQRRTRELNQLWTHSRDLMVLIDLQGRLIAVSPAWTPLLGHATADVLGRKLVEFLHPDDVASAAEALAGAAAGRHMTNFETRFLDRGGETRWVSWHSSVEDSLVHAYGRDITAEKAARAELAFTEEALRQSQKMEVVGQLTGGIAHDFNNLLGGISGSLELVQARMQQGSTEGVELYLATAQAATARAASLTQRLLAFSRRQHLDDRPTQVAALARGMADLVQRTVGPAIAVSIENESDAWPITVDGVQLESALLNLCINGRDAMPDGGELTIRVFNKLIDARDARAQDVAAGEYVALSVADTGTGMSEDIVEHAFDPFFTTKPLGEGTGLGLSMVYGFVRQSGGQVLIDSTPGEGATVTMLFPRYEGSVDDAAPDAAAANPAPSALGETVLGETVLVVDDEVSLRIVIGDFLRELGYVVLEAADGASALKILQSDATIDLLITDVGLPGGMNGRQVAEAGRATRPQLGVLFITGYAEKAVVARGGLEPGMQLLTKPFTISTLADRVRKMIGSRN